MAVPDGDDLPNDADALYEVRTTCPHCDEVDIVLVRLDAILTQTRAEAYLSVKASPKKIEHDCEQPSLLGHVTVERDDDETGAAA